MKIALSVKAKHGIIFQYLKNNNMSVNVLAKEIGVSYRTLLDYVNLRKTPNLKHKVSKESLNKLCKFFRCLPEDLFPEDLIRHVSGKSTLGTELGKEQILFFEKNLEYLEDMREDQLEQLAYTPKEYEVAGLNDTIKRVFATLKPKEEKVLRMRFGIGGSTTELSLEEVAKITGLTRERIRQIENKALRKLRHPSRGQALSQYWEDGGYYEAFQEEATGDY